MPIGASLYDERGAALVTEIMELAGSLNDLESKKSSLDVNRIVCGIVHAPTMSPAQLLNQTCPGLSSYVGDPPNYALLESTFQCSDAVVQFLTTPMTKTDIYGSLGTAILNFYPQGGNYDAWSKFIDYSKWECIGYLACIFAAFFVAYWFTSKLSIRLVKR